MEMLYKIKKSLKKKNEKIVVDLYLKDYDKSNFYFALVFNEKIEKFKVLYVPIDAYSLKDNIEEYFCYQFIFLHTVNYILEIFNNNKDKFLDDDFRNRCNKKMDSYYIELNYYDIGEEYKFTFSQFIDKDFVYLFEIIVILFEHAPNLVNELCNKLLLEFNDASEIVKYTNSYNFDLENDSLSDLFLQETIKRCKYSYDDISFLESTGNRYYAFVYDNLIVIDYYSRKQIFNVSCGNLDPLGDEVYIVTSAIKDGIEKKFYRLKVVDSMDDFNDSKDLANYYLCYGIDEEEFKIINTNLEEVIALSLVKRKCIKILNADSNLENKIREYLDKTYEEEKVKELMEYTFIKGLN